MLNFFKKQRPSEPAASQFEGLRARLEYEVERPCIVAITSSTDQDGRGATARGLARSLAIAGYSVLIADTAVPATFARKGQVPDFAEIGRQQQPAESGHDPLIKLGLCDPSLQRTTSQRDISVAFESLRGKFDYVIVSADCRVEESFGAALISAADAILVSVRTGRSQKAADQRLLQMLDRFESRFLGVVAISPSTIDSEQAQDLAFEGVRRPSIALARDYQRRDVVESAS